MLLFLVFSFATVAQTPSQDSEPKIIDSQDYVMPQAVADAGIDGKVLLEMTIDENGVPTKASIFAGPRWPCGKNPSGALKELAKTLTATMLGAKFSPAMKDGKPIQKDINVTIELNNPNFPAKALDVGGAIVLGRAKNLDPDVTLGKPKKMPLPRYPAGARANRAGGAVLAQILIDEKGNVIRSGAIRGHRELQQSARETACEAKFTPTLRSGQPIPVSGLIVYNFVP
ncbi:MAG: energy transducer TonB [Pyrinomonadaceae bacterium]